MQRFEASQLKRFLKAVDRHLPQPFRLQVIGDSAAVLAYGARRVTRDIDTWDDAYRQITPALQAASKETGLNIPVEHPGVADGPYNLEERLQRVRIPGLKRLSIWVPEKHDLVLMKMLRGEEPDLQAAEEIKQSHGLDLEILVVRYMEEMSQCVGEPRRFDLNLLALVDRLFGEEACKRVTTRLEARGFRNR